jgi:hypothetical protein
MPVSPDRGCHADSTPPHQALVNLGDRSREKAILLKKVENQNIQMVDLAQALKAAGDTKVTVEIGPQDHESFTPSEVVTVTP